MELDDFAVEHIFDEMDADLEASPNDNLLPRWRHRYEPFIYDILKQRYGAVLHAFWKGYEPPLTSDRAFVIVERRCHPNLWFILRNIAYFGKGWSIYLFCSKQNYDYCAAILGKNLKNVHLRVIFETHVDSATGVIEYNELLKKLSFWEQISAEHLCVFEMDCYLRRPIPDELLAYDYVGTPWTWNVKSPGGSGLTLRKRSVMLDICRKKEPGALQQDCFAAEGICELGYEFLHASEGREYFVESCITENPVGVHQWWTFFSKISKEHKDYFIRKLLTLEFQRYP